MDQNKELLLGAQQLEDWEGYSPVPYLDTECISTIGIGRNMEVFPLDPDELEEDGTYCHLNATAWAYDQLAECRKDVIIRCPWCVESPPEVRIILTDMAYNLGIKGLMGFKNMLARMKDKDFKQAAEELKDSKYFRQTKRRARFHYNTLMNL